MRQLPTTPPSRHRPQTGFTLVELMVALALSMILAAALLKMQVALGQQRVRTSDVAARDNEVRAAMDLMTQDMSGAGFLFGGAQTTCNALFTYDSAIPGSYFVHHSVDAVAAATGSVMTFGRALTLNYPVSGSGVPSDVLVVTGSTNAMNFNDQTSPRNTVNVDTTYAPLSTGVLPLSAAPAPPTAGDVAVVETPIQSKIACFRVPLVSQAPTNVWNTAGSPLMPATSFTPYAAMTQPAGFSDSLSDAELFASKVVDIGAPASPTQTTTAFYVDNSGAFPVLMRSVYSLLDDTAIGAPQQVAAGVVSLQVRFGVDPAWSGAITAYEDATTVTASKHWDAIRSVRVAIVTRSINDDPDANYVWTDNSTATAYTDRVIVGAPFAYVPVPTQFRKRRFIVQQTELATRNAIWTHP